MRQPDPVQGREEVLHHLLARIEQRKRQGIATYGTTLHTFNGRSALTDAIEEGIDKVIYLEQELLERAELNNFVELVASAEDVPEYYRAAARELVARRVK